MPHFNNFLHLQPRFYARRTRGSRLRLPQHQGCVGVVGAARVGVVTIDCAVGVVVGGIVVVGIVVVGCSGRSCRGGGDASFQVVIITIIVRTSTIVLMIVRSGSVAICDLDGGTGGG